MLLSHGTAAWFMSFVYNRNAFNASIINVANTQTVIHVLAYRAGPRAYDIMVGLCAADVK